MTKINPDLWKKIQQIITASPTADEDLIIDKIVASNSIRMKKQAIKIGVKEYFKIKATKIQPDKDKNKKDIIINLEETELNKPKKKVKREKGQIQIEFQDHPSYQFQNIGGVNDTILEIFNNIITPIQKKQSFTKLGIQSSRGFILAGPVGSGKSILGNCILSYVKNKHNFNAYSIHSALLTVNQAQENMKKLFQTAKENQPSIILIDDIDIICNKESNKRPQGSPIFTFLSEIDKVKNDLIYLVATSSNPEKLDVSLKKVYRFEKVITVNMSSDESREQILTKILIGTSNNLKKEQIIQISKLTSGFMAADLVTLIRESALHCILKNQSEPKLTSQNILNSIKYVQPVLKKEGFTDIPKTTLDDVGGLKNLKLQLEREIIIPMRDQKKFQEMNFQVQSGGVLLYGPPGCGKTMLAKAIANAVRANFIIVKGPELLNKYVGQSEQAVRQVFGRAQRAAPCVIFFDQFDALAPKRSDQGNQVTQRVVNTLLTALDGVDERKMVFVIAATNRKDMIDQATLRAGRIQKHLYVPEPNQQQRIDILKAITKSMKINKSLTFDEIAKSTKGFSGADLKFLVKQATVNAIVNNRNEVTLQDLNISLKQLLQAKNRDQLKQKVHELELKDDQQNQQFVYHSNGQKNKEQVAVEKQGSKIDLNKIPDSVIFEQLLKIIGRRKTKNNSKN